MNSTTKDKKKPGAPGKPDSQKKQNIGFRFAPETIAILNTYRRGIRNKVVELAIKEFSKKNPPEKFNQ